MSTTLPGTGAPVTTDPLATLDAVAGTTSEVIQVLSLATGIGTAFKRVNSTNGLTVQQRAADIVVSGLGTANTAFTTTLAAPAAGLFQYITAIEIIRLNPTATAVAAAAVLLSITSVNLPGSLAWSFSNALAAGAYDVPVRLTPNNPVRSSVAATATTITCPAAGAGVQFRVNVYYYTST